MPPERLCWYCRADLRRPDTDIICVVWGCEAGFTAGNRAAASARRLPDRALALGHFSRCWEAASAGRPGEVVASIPSHTLTQRILPSSEIVEAAVGGILYKPSVPLTTPPVRLAGHRRGFDKVEPAGFSRAPGGRLESALGDNSIGNIRARRADYHQAS